MIMSHKKATPLLVGIVLILALNSCFTGIEGTKRVEMGREDRRQAMPTPEETFLKLDSEPTAEWPRGKTFLATDDRLGYVLDIDGRGPGQLYPLKGKTLTYIESVGRPTPDGGREAVIVFESDGRRMTYNTGKSYPESLKTFTSENLPMLIDLKKVGEADRILRGKQVWTRSAIWYEGDSARVTGRKFVPVTITDVTTGVTEFPLKVSFRDGNGKQAYMLMNIGNGGYDSRSFANLFSLNDIRKQHPKISDENWERICNSRIATGMTKEECKLSLGNPGDVAAGHNYSQTLDIWQYPDGAVLRFADGVLVDYRY